MGEYTIKFDAADFASDIITQDLLGVNVVFTKDYVDEGSAFSRFVDEMGFNEFRFPGGTVTEEKFAPDNEMSDRFWDANDTGGYDAEGGSRIVTARAFIEYAAARDGSVDWVLPTENYFSDEVDEDGHREPSDYAIYTLLDDVSRLLDGQYGEVDLDTITIGNEYWYKQQRMTPEEYGKITNELAKGLQLVFDAHRATLDDPDSWEEPKIAMQAALRNRPEDNEKILSQMDMEARAAIDTVETHYYPDDYDLITSYDGVFDRLDEIQAAEGFGELEYNISEWNLRMDENADQGMEQGSSMIELFAEMAEHGVDQAAVWGTAYKKLQTRLAELEKDPDAADGWGFNMTAPGEVMRLMIESVEGTRLLDATTPESFRSGIGEDAAGQVTMRAFAGESDTVVFLSSRSSEEISLTLDMDDLVGDYGHLAGVQLTAMDDPTTTDIDEGLATEDTARAHMSTMGESDLIDANGNIRLTLDGYDIVRLTFTKDGHGVSLRGQDEAIAPDADVNDTLIGTNFDDTLYGGAGDDLLMGQGGDDLIMSGSGDDTLLGGAGEDILVATGERAFLDGGEDASHFIVDTGTDATIEGFDLEKGDTLSFFRAYQSAEDAMEAAIVENGNVIFIHEGGNTTLIGAADQFEGLASAMSDFAESGKAVDYLNELFGDTEPVAEASALTVEAAFEDDDALEQLLIEGSPDEIGTFLDGLSMDEMATLFDTVNVDALMATIPGENFAAMLNGLDSDTLRAFLDAAQPESLLSQFSRIGEAAADMLIDMDDAVAEAYLDRLEDSDFEDIPLDFEGEQLFALRDAMAAAGYDQDAARLEAEATQRGFSLEDQAAMDEEDEDNESGYSGVECFVATAAYADGHHPDVVHLRELRDHVLVHFALGRAFIWTYWRVGPWLADALRPYPGARGVARQLLGRFVSVLRRSDFVGRHDHGYRNAAYLSGRMKPSR